MFGHRYADEFEHFYALFFCGLLVRTVNVKKGDFVKLVSYRENGLSDVIGSWKIIAISLPLIFDISEIGVFAMS